MFFAVGFGALIVASFIPNKPDITNGFISCTFFLIGLVRDCITGRGDRDLKDHLASIDVKTLGFPYVINVNGEKK